MSKNVCIFPKNAFDVDVDVDDVDDVDVVDVVDVDVDVDDVEDVDFDCCNLWKDTKKPK